MFDKLRIAPLRFQEILSAARMKVPNYDIKVKNTHYLVAWATRAGIISEIYLRNIA